MDPIYYLLIYLSINLLITLNFMSLSLNFTSYFARNNIVLREIQSLLPYWEFGGLFSSMIYQYNQELISSLPY